MNRSEEIKKQFPYFQDALVAELVTHAIEKEFEKETELVREGQIH